MATIAEALAIAVNYHQSGNLTAAEEIYRKILTADPNQPDAWHLLGLCAHAVGGHDLARQCIERALQLRPNQIDYQVNFAIVLTAAGQSNAAIETYENLLKVAPNEPRGLNNLGNLYRDQGELPKAIELLKRLIKLAPDEPQSHFNLALALQDCERWQESEQSYLKAIQIDPQSIDAKINLGVLWRIQGRLADAWEMFIQALAQEPERSQIHFNLGCIRRDQYAAHEAISHFQKANQLQPNDPETLFALGTLYRDISDHASALDAFEKCLQLRPDSLSTLGALIYQRQQMCDWDGIENQSRQFLALLEQTSTHAQEGVPDAVPPFMVLSLPVETSPKQQLLAADCWVKGFLPNPSPIKSARSDGAAPLDQDRKINIGYLSPDFRSHAIGWVIADLFAHHDRSRFRVYGYSFGSDDNSSVRTRIQQGMDHWRDITKLSHREAAQQIADDDIDILVDLAGYIRNARTEILSYRPAPVQVNYFGYPGTMGLPAIDYLIADPSVIHVSEHSFYSETVLDLPHCYMVNSPHREVIQEARERSFHCLPVDHLVYCCFNNHYKITTVEFSLWMDILRSVPRSVLWLLEGNRHSKANLIARAEQLGIDPHRLIFAPRLPITEHLERYHHADLFLDTFQYNAHVTASDSLWMGCPLLSLPGRTFASRVASSLLRAIGMEEFIASNIDHYRQLAIQWGQNPSTLAVARSKLVKNRASSPLFDIKQFTRDLESLFVTMHDSKKNPAKM